MATISVFGANGQTGKALLDLGLSQKHSLVGAVRRADSLADYSDRVEVREYDFRRPASVRAALRGSDIVVSAVGSGSNAAAAKPTTLYSDSVRSLTTAMREEGIERLLVISSAGVDYDPRAPWYYRYFFRPYLMNSYMDMMKMETLLEATASDLDWTIVRPTYLLDGDQKGYLVKDHRLGGGNFKIHRSDVADFMLKEATARNWVHQHPVLGYH